MRLETNISDHKPPEAVPGPTQSPVCQDILFIQVYQQCTLHPSPFALPLFDGLMPGQRCRYQPATHMA